MWLCILELLNHLIMVWPCKSKFKLHGVNCMCVPCPCSVVNNFFYKLLVLGHNFIVQIVKNFWIKIDQLDVTRFIISLFTAEHVSNVSTSIFRSLRLIVDLFHGLYCSGSMCVGVTVWFGWGGVVSLCRLRLCQSKHVEQ